MLDQLYCGKYPLSKSTSELFYDLTKQYSPIPYPNDIHWQTKFGHLIGYASSYYSYTLDTIVAGSLWKCLFDKDPLSRYAGMKYWNNLLIYGGSMDSMEILQNILGKPPSINDLILMINKY